MLYFFCLKSETNLKKAYLPVRLARKIAFYVMVNSFSYSFISAGMA